MWRTHRDVSAGISAPALPQEMNSYTNKRSALLCPEERDTINQIPLRMNGLKGLGRIGKTNEKSSCSHHVGAVLVLRACGGKSFAGVWSDARGYP